VICSHGHVLLKLRVCSWDWGVQVLLTTTAACTHFTHKVQTIGGGVQTRAGEGGEVGASVTYSKGLIQLMPAAHVRGG